MRTLCLVCLCSLAHAACGEPTAEVSAIQNDAEVADASGTADIDITNNEPDTNDRAPDTESDSGPVICAEGMPCNDGDFCTKNDICTAGICAGEPYSCADDLECTLDLCDGKGGCNASLESGNWCLILGTCVPDGESHPENPCLACVTPVSSLDWSENDGGTCEDGLECTAKDRCVAGKCQGTANACVDGNPCTTDGCKEGEGCIHAALQGACEDGNVCTVGDNCTNALCTPGPSQLNCDDGNQCTVDTCDAILGCIQTIADEVVCDDGNPCTTGDACVLGECISGTTPLNCNDNDPCTNDACLKGNGCVHVPNLSSCTDGDPCTVGDICSGGSCLPGTSPKDCDDGNECTNDVCTPNLGCEHVPKLGTCNDGDNCTVDDTCQSGQCVGGSIAECDDGDECTDDVCNTDADGCEFIFNNAPCDDGNPCTLGDACSNGNCSSIFADCDDNNPCTLDQCVGNAECVHETLSTDECLVAITITTPSRGAEFTGSGLIMVKGSVQSPAGDIASLEINGNPVTVKANGAFSTVVFATHGMNIIEVIATDVLENTDKAVRSFYFSQSFRPMSSTNPTASKISKGVYFTLGPQTIDDGVHDPNDVNDLATLFEILINSFDIDGLLPNPLVNNDDYKVTVGNIGYSAPKVQLTPIAQGISLLARIDNFNAPLSADGKCFFCPNADGSIKISEIRITTTLVLSTQNGKVNATLLDTEVLLIGLDVDIDGVLGSIFDFLVDFIVGEFTTTIESAFETQIGAAIPPIIEEALGSLALNTSFQIPAIVPGASAVNVQINSGMENITFNEDGGRLRLWGAATTPKNIDITSKGTLLRSACLSGGGESLNLEGEQPLQVGLVDDLLNQVLYALWWGGGLDFPVPSNLLGDTDLSSFGIQNVSLDLKLLLPPIVTACNTAEEPVIQVGDIEVIASLDLFGNPVDLAIYASAQAPVTITADDGILGLVVSDVDTVKTEVVVLTPGFASAEKAIEALVAEELVPTLLSLIGDDALAGFPLPEIDLSGLVTGVPAGTTLSINPNTVTRNLGWTIVRGDIQ